MGDEDIIARILYVARKVEVSNSTSHCPFILLSFFIRFAYQAFVYEKRQAALTIFHFQTRRWFILFARTEESADRTWIRNRYRFIPITPIPILFLLLLLDYRSSRRDWKSDPISQAVLSTYAPCIDNGWKLSAGKGFPSDRQNRSAIRSIRDLLE